MVTRVSSGHISYPAYRVELSTYFKSQSSRDPFPSLGPCCQSRKLTRWVKTAAVHYRMLGNQTDLPISLLLSPRKLCAPYALKEVKGRDK